MSTTRRGLKLPVQDLNEKSKRARLAKSAVYATQRRPKSVQGQLAGRTQKAAVLWQRLTRRLCTKFRTNVPGPAASRYTRELLSAIDKIPDESARTRVQRAVLDEVCDIVLAHTRKTGFGSGLLETLARLDPVAWQAEVHHEQEQADEDMAELNFLFQLALFCLDMRLQVKALPNYPHETEPKTGFIRRLSTTRVQVEFARIGEAPTPAETVDFKVATRGMTKELVSTGYVLGVRKFTELFEVVQWMKAHLGPLGEQMTLLQLICSFVARTEPFAGATRGLL